MYLFFFTSFPCIVTSLRYSFLCIVTSLRFITRFCKPCKNMCFFSFFVNRLPCVEPFLLFNVINHLHPRQHSMLPSKVYMTYTQLFTATLSKPHNLHPFSACKKISITMCILYCVAV